MMGLACCVHEEGEARYPLISSKGKAEYHNMDITSRERYLSTLDLKASS